MLRRFLFLLLLCVTLNGLTTIAGAQELPELQPITPENAAQLEQLAMLGMGGLGSITWSPDGETIEVRGSIGRWLLDSETLTPLRFIEQYAPLNVVQIDLLITEDENGSTQVSRFHAWDTATYTKLHLTEDPYTIFTYLGLSPDGTRLVGCYTTDPLKCSSIVGWNMKTFLTEKEPAQKMSYGKQPYTVNTLAFRPDSTLLAAGEDEDSIVVWNVDTGKQLLDTNQTGVSPRFNPDAKLLVFFGDEGGVHIWNIEAQIEQIVLQPLDDLYIRGVPGEYGYVPYGWSYAFNQDNSQMAIDIDQYWFNNDGVQITTGYVRVYDTNTGAEIVKITAENNQIGDVAFNNDGTQIAVTKSSGISLYDVETGKELAASPTFASFTNLKFASDGTILARTQAGYDPPEEQPPQQLFFFFTHGDSVLRRSSSRTKDYVGRWQ
jgi:WD40 repeat protein